MRTLNNTKSNGRYTAQDMIRNGALPNEVRSWATLLETGKEAPNRRHFAAGFAEVVYRRACWNDFWDNWAHEGNQHSDATGHGWTQARGTRYCPAEGGYVPRNHACVDDVSDES